MLALKGILAQSDRISVLVFDEIDANVGGRLGSTIGSKLRHLAAHHQVLCITHLPQIASYADRHLTVRKEVVGKRNRHDRARHGGRRTAAGAGRNDRRRSTSPIPPGPGPGTAGCRGNGICRAGPGQERQTSPKTGEAITGIIAAHKVSCLYHIDALRPPRGFSLPVLIFILISILI